MSDNLNFKKPMSALNKVAAFVGTIFVIGSVFTLYMNNIWHPKIKVNQVDWDKGIAEIDLNGKPTLLYGDTTLAGGWGWGVKFSKAPDYQDAGYDRIEIVKSEQVYHIISKRPLPNVE